MSFLKKPFKKLKEIGTPASSNNTSTESVPSKTEGVDTALQNGYQKEETKTAPSSAKANGTTTPDASVRRRTSIEDKQRRSLDRERQKAETKYRQSLARIESEKFMNEGPPELTKLYRPYSMNMSKRWNHETRVLFKDLDLNSKCYSNVWASAKFF